MKPPVVALSARVERKDPSLPRFLVVPPEALSAWTLEGTTVVEARLDDIEIGRRTLKPWGHGRDVWFIELTRGQCRAAGVDTGDTVRVELRRASTEPPEEILALVRSDPSLAERWDSMTPARRRQLGEHVRGAKKAETRARRARKGLS